MKITINKIGCHEVDNSHKENGGDLPCDHCGEIMLESDYTYTLSILKHDVIILDYSGEFYCSIQCVSTQIKDYERSN